MRIAKGLIIIGLCLLLTGGLAGAGDKKLKAGFVYVGPVGDYGWSQPGHGFRIQFWDNGRFSDWIKRLWAEQETPDKIIRDTDHLADAPACSTDFIERNPAYLTRQTDHPSDLLTSVRIRWRQRRRRLF